MISGVNRIAALSLINDATETESEDDNIWTNTL